MAGACRIAHMTNALPGRTWPRHVGRSTETGTPPCRFWAPCAAWCTLWPSRRRARPRLGPPAAGQASPCRAHPLLLHPGALAGDGAPRLAAPVLLLLLLLLRLLLPRRVAVRQ
ncbi:unnamed protein product, partial [Prorocentrum cordatum]